MFRQPAPRPAGLRHRACRSALFLVCVVPYFSRDGGSVVVLAGMCAALAFRRLSPGARPRDRLGDRSRADGDRLSTRIRSTSLILRGALRDRGLRRRRRPLARARVRAVGAVVITGYASCSRSRAVRPRHQAQPLAPGVLSDARRTRAQRRCRVPRLLVGFGLAWTVGLLVRTRAAGARQSSRAAVRGRAGGRRRAGAHPHRPRHARRRRPLARGRRSPRRTARATAAAPIPSATDAALSTIASTAREALVRRPGAARPAAHSQGDAPAADARRPGSAASSSCARPGLTVAREVSGDAAAARRRPAARGLPHRAGVADQRPPARATPAQRSPCASPGRFTASSSPSRAAAASRRAGERRDVELPAGHGIAGMTRARRADRRHR